MSNYISVHLQDNDNNEYGDLWKDGDTGDVYVLARVTKDTTNLISLSSGNRYYSDQYDKATILVMIEKEGFFTKLKKGTILNITAG
jgi:hypothetical protein